MSNVFHRFLVASALIVPLFGMFGCATPSKSGPHMAPIGTIESAQVTIRGSFSYRQHIALPADAVVEFALRDISLMDAEAPLLAELRYVLNGRQVPLSYEFKVRAAAIADKGRRFGISARITAADGRLIWVTDTNFTLPEEHGNLIDMGELQLVPVR